MFQHTCHVEVAALSSRERYIPGGGGALNANYQQVDALSNISNILGTHGLKYNRDWWWSGLNYPYGKEMLQLEFKDPENLMFAMLLR